MNYAKIILEAELKSLKRKEFPWLIKKFGGDKGQSQRIKDVEDALLILNGEIREICESFCSHCKKNPVHETYWLCKECIDAYNLEKQKDYWERT